MKTFILVILALVFINSIFSIIPVMYPTVGTMAYMPYQAWYNLLVVFMLVLDKYKATYLWDQMEEAKSSPNLGAFGGVEDDVKNVSKEKDKQQVENDEVLKVSEAED